MFNGFIKQLALKPKNIFLVDGTGAFVTAFLLFFVLRNFNHYFAVPPEVLLWLLAIATVFCLYSLSCFFLLKNNWKPFLKIIVTANLLYCCLTMGFVLYSYHTLTPLALVYFFAEIVIICILVFIEVKILRTIPHK